MNWIVTGLAGLLMTIVGLGFFGTFVVLPGLRVFYWLKEGAWPRVTPALLGFPPPKVSWVGAQQVIVSIFDFSVEIVAFAFFGVLWVIANRILINCGRRRIETGSS